MQQIRRARAILGPLAATVLGIALAGPALAARPVSTASIDFRDTGSCTFEATYQWSNWGGGKVYAFSIIAWYVRQPGLADELAGFSQQSDNDGQTAKAGTNTYRWSMVQYLQGRVLDPEARIVAVAELLVNPKNRDNYIEHDARREASMPVPSACIS